MTPEQIRLHRQAKKSVFSKDKAPAKCYSASLYEIGKIQANIYLQKV
jgi:hypothetical protein